jgi:AcrR family transcriptional regulator
MARWEPDARGRLAQAALELYGEHGFEQTTVAQIAERAGLTERTFFRHFADKREVLFGGGSDLQDLVVQAVEDAPASAEPIDAVAAGFEAGARLLDERSGRDFARRRQAAITANGELQERELSKLAALSSGVAAALRARGVPGPAAALTAEAGMAVFKVAFERWVEEGEERDLPTVMRDSLDELRSAVGS